MSGKEHGSSTRSDSSPVIDPCILSDGQVKADSSSASPNDGSAISTDCSTSMFLSSRTGSSATNSNESRAALLSSKTGSLATTSNRSTALLSSSTDRSTTSNLSTMAFLSSTTTSSAATIDGLAAVVDGSAITTDGTAAAMDGSVTTTDVSAAAIGGAVTTTDGSETKSGTRFRFASWQLNRLEAEFLYSRHLNVKRKAIIAADLKITEDQVRNWFAKKRTKNKVQQEQFARQLTTHKASVTLPTFGPAAPLMHTNLCPAQDSSRIQHWIQSGHQFPPDAFRQRWVGEPIEPNVYVEIEPITDEQRRQLPDVRTVRGDQSRSPAAPHPSLDPSQSAGMHHSSSPPAPHPSRDPARPAGIHHSSSPAVSHPSRDPARLAGIHRFPANPNPSHDPISGQKVEVRAQGDVRREHVRNFNAATWPHGYYVPVEQYPDGSPWQQLSDARPVRRERSRSPVDIDPGRDPVPGQEIEVRADGQEAPYRGDSRREIVHNLNVATRPNWHNPY